MSYSPVEILLVEDNPADADLVQRKMKSAKIMNNLHVVHSGTDALRFVRREGPFADALKPDLILLDLNLPGIDGREVLGTIKSDPGLRSIPVVILTSSDAEEDIARSYELHANAYVRKPVDLDGYRSIVSAIDNFWFGVVRLNSRSKHATAPRQAPSS